jgi:hypothetical protein
MESYKATNNEVNHLNLAEIIEGIEPKQFNIRGVATDNQCYWTILSYQMNT